MMTGRYQQAFGHEFNAGGAVRAKRQGLGTPITEVMLPARLKAVGYETGMVGKWHLGATEPMHPISRGFGEFFGFLHGANQYFDPLKRTDGQYAAGGDDGPQTRPAINPVLRGRTPVSEHEYLTDAFTREAVDFIRRHQKETFFLYLAYNAPHSPYQVTSKYYDRFPEISNHTERVYRAMISAVDDGVGEVLKALKENGILESTLVLFTSDNGCATYLNACTNLPLAGGKLLPLEGGVRVPYLLQWAGHFKAGEIISEPVSTLDIVPTALDLAGVDSATFADTHFPGQSLLPLLAGEASGKGKPLFWRNGPNWGVRAGSWKLVGLNENQMLFNLQQDLGETNNLIKTNSEQRQRLKGLYDDWEKSTREPLWPPKNVLRWSLDLPGIGKREIDIAI
jgi:arylsulfatase A-like enzyme